MNKRILGSRMLPAAATVVAFAFASAAAVGQDSPAVKIQAGKITTVTQVDFHGIRNESLQLSRNISYADLDLRTASGAAQLETRIRDTADAICKQLMDASPATNALAEVMDHKTCVNGAVAGAMSKAKHVIASAEANKRG